MSSASVLAVAQIANHESRKPPDRSVCSSSRRMHWTTLRSWRTHMNIPNSSIANTAQMCPTAWRSAGPLSNFIPGINAAPPTLQAACSCSKQTKKDPS